MRDATAGTAPLDSRHGETGMQSSGMRTYAESANRGLYGRHLGGLSGKQDNVRTCWEDQQTQFVLRRFVQERLAHAAREGRGLRVLDLGCGAGQGYELLTGIRDRSRNHLDVPERVLPASAVSTYYGLDLSQAMLDQARRNLPRAHEATFRRTDLSDGLGPAAHADSFDVYYSSYGALSHLGRDALRALLVEIARHARPGAIAVLDLLGRLSPEWPVYWNVRDGRMLDYSMSYLYSEEERKRGDVERFPMQYWTGEEVTQLAARVVAETGVPVEVLARVDRSVLVGRHVDTREYGCRLPRLRSLVNSLYELNVSTPLEGLRIEAFPEAAGDADGSGRRATLTEPVSRFFDELVSAWTCVIDFTLERLRGERVDLVAMDGWQDHPPALQSAIMTMDRVVDSVSWMDVGDPRSNIVEPQLAYALRRLEYAMQRGAGCGHGLLAVVRIGAPGASDVPEA